MQPEPLTAALVGLRQHIYLEEVFLFPPIRESGMVTAKEEPVIYPHADTDLPPQTSAELTESTAVRQCRRPNAPP